MAVGALVSCGLLMVAVGPLVRQAVERFRGLFLRTPFRALGLLVALGCLVAYAGTKPPVGCYGVAFDLGGVPVEVPAISCEAEKVYKLPVMSERLPSGFLGWACSNGRRYDDGMLVFNLAKPGETVTMTAVWE